MPASAITTTQQNIQITDVTDVVVSTIEQDTISGDYVRTIQIWGTPEPAGNNVLVLQLRLRSTDSVALKVVSPQSEF